MTRLLEPLHAEVTVTRAQRVRIRLIARRTAAVVCIGSGAAAVGMVVWALYTAGLLGWAILAGALAWGIGARWRG